MPKEKRLVPKAYRRLAEIAAENYCYHVLDCVRTVRAVSTAYCRQDLFASDVLARKRDGSLVAVQVTSGQDDCVTKRKRKLEAEVWHSSDTVLILRLYWEPSPQCKRGKLWYFKVWEYVVPNKYIYRTWVHMANHAVIKDWFKLYKGDKNE